MTLTNFLKRELHALSDGRHTWYLLGLHDVKGRYRRSIIGPFWITLSSLVFVGGLGVVYSRLLNLNLEEYLPYLACGIIVWTFILNFINEGASALIGSAHIIKQVSLPLLTHMMRVAFRNTLIFLHSWVILIPLLLWYGYLTTYGLFCSILGVALVIFTLTPLTVLLAIVCARYRDVLPMISSALQLMFFVTPVMWFPQQLAGLTSVIKYNPFAYLIDLIREPMLNGFFPLASAGLVLGMGLLLWAAALALLFTHHKQIPYWL